MVDVADLMLERVRRIEEKLDLPVDHVIEIKTGQTLLRHDIANIHAQMAHTNERLDRMEGRLSRMERRLDLVESP